MTTAHMYTLFIFLWNKVIFRKKNLPPPLIINWSLLDIPLFWSTWEQRRRAGDTLADCQCLTNIGLWYMWLTLIDNNWVCLQSSKRAVITKLTFNVKTNKSRRVQIWLWSQSCPFTNLLNMSNNHKDSANLQRGERTRHSVIICTGHSFQAKVEARMNLYLYFKSNREVPIQ